MEANRSRLMRRLAWMFRSPSLLHFSCNPSSSAAANLSSAGSTRDLLRDVVHEPALVPRSLVQDHHDDDDEETLGSRSFALPTTEDHQRRPPLTAVTVRRSFHCSGCRQNTCALELSQPLFSKARKKKTRKEARAMATAADGGGECIRTRLPVPPSAPWKSSYYNIYSSGTRVDRNKKKLSTNAYGFTSSSSVESDHELGFFSSEEEEEEETRTFFSSRSLSSISSAFYRRPSSIKNKIKIKKKDKKKSQYHDDWGICQGFQPLLSVDSSKVQKETKSWCAVTKRSMDPYGDFRRSMAEMIIERQIFGAGDLEGLLQSYLLLNSPSHRSIIIEAFSDIWLSLSLSSAINL